MQKTKTFTLRLPHDLWQYLKISSVKKEVSLNQLIEDCLSSFKDRRENKLQKNETTV